MMQSKPYARVAGPRVAAVQANVALAADLQRAYDEAIRLFGKIDIVVNSAGTSRTGAFEEITDEVWREDFDEKLFAAIRLTRLVWAQMKERRWGRVINVLNVGAKAARPKSAPTSITRAAGMALTKVLAGEGAPHNVLVNALLVGFIEADQHVRAAEKAGIELKEYINARIKDVPLGRWTSIATSSSSATRSAWSCMGSRQPCPSRSI